VQGCEVLYRMQKRESKEPEMPIKEYEMLTINHDESQPEFTTSPNAHGSPKVLYEEVLLSRTDSSYREL
jgi:hypothetical protein